ncbi:MAG: helix-turn-helix transcriptional regulator [Oscillospiraceae bacterium]|nr:helix-turn-helix transcriptional regulator [Oscillospiraceae bacterium]
MDQIKIGRFIAERRKNAGLTQLQLAEMLGITDRAISKWETGKAMPDSSIMLELCGILKITVNDLLSGEVVTMENYNRELETNLIEMVRQKEQADKRLLTIEIVMCVVCLLPLLAAVCLVNVISLEEWMETVIVLAGIIPLLIATPFALKIEQKAGYYVCKECGHKYVPKYGNVFWAMHMGRTRYMKCPACGKRSWQKKVISKE